MSVLFIHPPIDAFRSGGNVYNAVILQLARQNRYPVTSLAIDNSRNVFDALCGIKLNRYRMMILDSLFISDFQSKYLSHDWPSVCLLLHDLASQNPALEPSQQVIASNKENALIARAERIIVTGHSIQTLLKKRFSNKKIFVCEPGIDTSIFRASRSKQGCELDRPVNILSAGNFLPRKDYLGLLRVLAHLSNQKWHWRIVGDEGVDPDYSFRFRRESERLNLSNRITLCGSIPLKEVAMHLEKADLFLFASRYETYGMALSEAVAMGVPVVTTRVGDAERLVRHGKTGYLVAIGDWTCFESYTSKLLKSQELRLKFKSNYRDCLPRSWRQTFEDFSNACNGGHESS